mmetsp:Transcript_10527/g.23171  ORF Transcript_10527/g.23171 Transcript_10527/m.23171 type:complete len:952 (+) Transcript_10527:63-2918(+)|eukprot:CAMPEP_0206532980 /NCGR_PEP_ID=MMETSP0325_2-20121206/4695_1 /ASSEMBLY_ACC=CAM_ASM_000347 /TAXON_ID=2866 /ORGANISM="Crypthecodinium cohnii, Strain Seligo" /LENGTH=951 /DNA_ID=CAMNT_0054029541 /DNA_START=18 /DNA_END=2873 /DNA_ORIENTATION=+
MGCSDFCLAFFAAPSSSRAPEQRAVGANGGSGSAPSRQRRVELNVGGQRFTTSRATLERYPGTPLSSLLDEGPDEDGAYFLDRDGRLFVYILNFLRDGCDDFLPPPAEDIAGLRREAKHLGLSDLVKLLDIFKDQNQSGEKMAAPDKAPGPAEASLPVPAQEQAPIPDPEPECQVASVCHLADPSDDGHGNYFGAPIPCNELQRLEKLVSLEQLRTSPENQYDHITSIVAALLDVPIVLISLVAKEVQWFKSKTGVDAESTPRNLSFCAFMLKPEQPSCHTMLVIEDAHRDPRVWNNGLVTGAPYIRFYAGCPLVTSEGFRLGALCAIDRIPRTLSPDQFQILVNFGQLTVSQLEQKQIEDRLSKNADADADLDEAPCDFSHGPLREQRMREIVSEVIVLVWAQPGGKEWPIIFANKAWTDTTGILVAPPTKFPGDVKITDATSEQNGMPKQQLPSNLWNYLSPAPNEAAKYDKFRKALEDVMNPATATTNTASVVAAASSTGQLPTLSLSADLKTLPKQPGQRELRPVLCRFAPANVPLDVAAASIRPAGSYSMENPQRLQPRGFPPGVLYFCVMRAQEDRIPVQEALPATSPPAAQSKATPAKPSSSGSERGYDGATLDLSSLRTSAKAAGTSDLKPPRPEELQKKSGPGWKPPVSPYEDVRVLRLAGEGSFGKVYFGLWNGMAVAVKVISNLSKTHQKLTLPPEVEAELSSLISHQGLVRTYQYCTRTVPDTSITTEDEGPKERSEMWIVQEWCDGGTLRKLCKQPRTHTEGILEATEIFLEIAQALEYLHERRIVHGDLTPNNVMLQSQPTRKGFVCKVCDFGRARIFDADTQEIMTRTMGTVTHMPPELFVTNIESCVLTPRADVYALGIVMYEVIAGKQPYAGLSPPQVVLRVASGKRLELPKEVTPELVTLYRSCVARQSQDRPQSPDLVRSIEQFYDKCLSQA